MPLRRPGRTPERKVTRSGVEPIPPEVTGVLSPAEVALTAETIAEWQLSTGMIPWFPGGHADPWNHVEAAMALAVAGLRTEAEAAYQWLADIQRPDGSWHQYYVADGVEQDKLDANVIAYIATGVWHHYLLYGDRGFLATMGPVVEEAIDFVLDLQTPRGEILWARHPDGTPWPFALLTGSSSIAHSLRCGLAIAHELGQQRPAWELALARLAHAIGHHRHDAFAPKDRWAMDWYYPVLSGMISGESGREHLADRYDMFVIAGEGVRCVSDRDWVTVAETCECAMAFCALGDRTRASDLFGWAQKLRDPDGRYRTGVALPDRVAFPPNERTTYSAAAVVLAADAIGGRSPASLLFTHKRSLPAVLDLEITDRSLSIEPGPA